MLFAAGRKIEHASAQIITGTKFSFLAFFKAGSVGGDGLQGRVFVAPEAGATDATDRAISLFLSSTTALRYSKYFGTNSGIWDVTSGWGTGRWICVAITHDFSSTSNVPLIYTRDFLADKHLISRTLSVITTPSGTASHVPATGYCIGNRTANNRSFDGPIAFVQFWDGRILTDRELQEAMKHPGKIRDGQTLNLWLRGGARNRARVRQDPTVTACTEGEMPPGIVPWRPTVTTVIFEHAAGGGGQTVEPAGYSAQAAYGTFAVSPGPVTIAPDSLVARLIYGAFDVAQAAGQTIEPASAVAQGAYGSFTLAPGAVSITFEGHVARVAAGSFAVSPGEVTVTLNGLAAQGILGAVDVVLVITPASATAQVSFGNHAVTPGQVTLTPDGLVVQTVYGSFIVTREGDAAEVLYSRVVVTTSPTL